jgi:hypothetical protein
LQAWLQSLGADEYFGGFAIAGYDIDFIAKEGLGDGDLDCVGVPMSKLGLRRKLISKHNISDFLQEAEEESSEGEESGGESEEDED